MDETIKRFAEEWKANFGSDPPRFDCFYEGNTENPAKLTFVKIMKEINKQETELVRLQESVRQLEFTLKWFNQELTRYDMGKVMTKHDSYRRSSIKSTKSTKSAGSSSSTSSFDHSAGVPTEVQGQEQQQSPVFPLDGSRKNSLSADDENGLDSMDDVNLYSSVNEAVRRNASLPDSDSSDDYQNLEFLIDEGHLIGRQNSQKHEKETISPKPPLGPKHDLLETTAATSPELPPRDELDAREPTRPAPPPPLERLEDAENSICSEPVERPPKLLPRPHDYEEIVLPLQPRPKPKTKPKPPQRNSDRFSFSPSFEFPPPPSHDDDATSVDSIATSEDSIDPKESAYYSQVNIQKKKIKAPPPPVVPPQIGDKQSGVGRPLSLVPEVPARPLSADMVDSDEDASSKQEEEQQFLSPATAEKLNIRHIVVMGIVESEKSFRDGLEVLYNYGKTLKSVTTSSQPVISIEDCNAIFFRVPELHHLHQEFYQNLKNRVDNWSCDTRIGDLYDILVSNSQLYLDYLNNYEVALATLEKCYSKGDPRFVDLANFIKIPGKEAVTLETLLYIPIQRMTKMTLTLHDLIRHTPEKHPDFSSLRDQLKFTQKFLEQVNNTTRRKASTRFTTGGTRVEDLVADSFFVELADGSRKLRHILLFSDIILCAKQKNPTRKGKVNYDCKWYIPLTELSLTPVDESQSIASIPVGNPKESEGLRLKITELKAAIHREKKKSGRSVEKLTKKLAELEGQFLLASPCLPFTLYNRSGKSYTLLMSSDYERSEWRDHISKAKSRCFSTPNLTPYELQMLMSSCTKLCKLNNIGSQLIQDDEEYLSGILNVVVHSAGPFEKQSEYFCCIEVDSYGYFHLKARTRFSRVTNTPVWNEEFDLDLEAALSLRILCYQHIQGGATEKGGKQGGGSQDIVVSKGAYEVGLISPSGGNKEIKITAGGGVTFILSLKYEHHSKTLKRKQSKRTTGFFGVRIATVARRERCNIPSIISMCVEEVERRGMLEVGIYRISGVVSDVSILKKAFDTHHKNLLEILGEKDINAVAALLKLYLRELPEPLFTNKSYADFVNSLSLKDPEARQNLMSTLLFSLPEPNKSTVLFLINHLKRVAANSGKNKMTLHNLATVFGPTLLRPGTASAGGLGYEQDPSALSNELSSMAGVMSQVGVLLHYLENPNVPPPTTSL